MKTETINIQEKYEDQLNDLWSQTINSNNCNNSPYKEIIEIIKRGYAIESKVTKNSILFISMNPSLPKDEKNGGNCEGYVFYDIHNNVHPFWRALNELYGKLDDPKPLLSHHDLLFIRETSQKKVLSLKNEKKLKNFFDCQLQISKEIINDSKPVLIVVLNAGARTLFEELFDKELCAPSYDKDLGAYIYNIGGKKTPVLFSGMLSGQHSLDIGSRESLIWHINYILKKILVQ